MSKTTILGIIIGILVSNTIFTCEIKDELRHTKKLLHLQNDITNQLLIELTNQKRKKK